MSHDQIERLTPNSRKRLEEQRVHGLDQMKLWAPGILPARLSSVFQVLATKAGQACSQGKNKVEGHPTTLKYSQGR